MRKINVHIEQRFNNGIDEVEKRRRIQGRRRKIMNSNAVDAINNQVVWMMGEMIKSGFKN
jgi:hypothetical protein